MSTSTTTKALFTLEEAVSALPLVRAIAGDLVADFRALRTAGRERRALQVEGGPLAAQRHARALEIHVQELSDRVEGCLKELQALGLEVRDLELGMVDFPTLLGSEPAFFCWRVDDPTIAFWHSADKGHRERLPLNASALPVA
jgi:hypothetical protein